MKLDVWKLQVRLAEVGMSQAEFGRALGCNESVVAGYLSGENQPNPARITEMAAVLTCNEFSDLRGDDAQVEVGLQQRQAWVEAGKPSIAPWLAHLASQAKAANL